MRNFLVNELDDTNLGSPKKKKKILEIPFCKDSYIDTPN